jgi:hypothetical protein
MANTEQKQEKPSLRERAAALIQAMRNWSRAPSGDSETARGVAEEMNAVLPEAVSGRGAVLAKRKQLEALDRATKVE